MKHPAAPIFGILTLAVLVFIASPFVILTLFAFSEQSTLSFPITGLTLAWFGKLFEDREFWLAFSNSLVITGSVGAVSTLLGTMSAIALTRAGPRTGSVLRGAIMVPLMLPPLVLGVGLLTYFVTLGIKLDLITVILSHVVFTQPIVILIVYARLEKFDEAVIHSARDLGATPLQAFFQVTLPIIGPTVIGAALVAMALSVDDFIITFFTIGGGNTLPTFLWGMLRKGMNPSINAVALILMAVTISVSVLSMRFIRHRK